MKLFAMLLSLFLLLPVAKAEEVEIIPRGDHTLLVNTMINGKAIGVLMVDTGASYVVLSPALASKLKLDSTQAIPIQAAGQIVSAKMVFLDSLQIGTIVLHNVPAVIQPIADDDPVLAGMIGMSALSRLNMRIEDNRLFLSPR